MKTITIAFDVDGTLRCNCTETCQDGNQRMYDLFVLLHHMKNTELFVWSGGGADYAWHFATEFGLPVKRDHCISKIGAPHMNIAVDDQQSFELADINLIVREK